MQNRKGPTAPVVPLPACGDYLYNLSAHCFLSTPLPQTPNNFPVDTFPYTSCHQVPLLEKELPQGLSAHSGGHERRQQGGGWGLDWGAHCQGGTRIVFRIIPASSDT